MRDLGIDHGDRRIGLAISDTLGMVAGGLPTITYKKEEDALAEIAKIVEERQVEKVVLGMPKNMDGSVGEQAQKVIDFAEKLKSLDIPIEFVDERLTSERANRVMIDAGMKWQKLAPTTPARACPEVTP